MIKKTVRFIMKHNVFVYGFVAFGLKIAKEDEPEEYSENIPIRTYDSLAMNYTRCCT